MDDQSYRNGAMEVQNSMVEGEDMARVVSPRLIIVLAALATMVAVGIYWCLFGTMSYKVTGQGVVFPFEEAAPLSVPYDGTAGRTLVSHGSTVACGAGVMEVANGLSTSVVRATREGVVIATVPAGTPFKAGEPLAWLLPQERQSSGREMLCYVPYKDIRKLKVGQEVQATPANMKREEWGYAKGTVTGVEHYPTSREEVARRLKLDPLASFVPDGEAVYEVRVTLAAEDGGLVWSRKKSRAVEVTSGTICNIQVITEKKAVWRVLLTGSGEQ